MSFEISRRGVLRIMFGISFVPAFSRPSFADQGGDGENKSDDEDKEEKSGGEADESNEAIGAEQKSIEDAAKNEKATSLTKLLNHLNKNYPGEILNVGLKKRGTDFIYAVKVLTAQGKVLNLKLDAKTLAKL
jgi:uncharacterized membrane protein YkoI